MQLIGLLIIIAIVALVALCVGGGLSSPPGYGYDDDPWWKPWGKRWWKD